MKDKLQILGLVAFMFLSVFSHAQVTQSTSHTTNYTKFTTDQKQFNDWSIAVFAGANALQNTDLVSWGEGQFKPGYDFQIQLTKQITHAFGIALAYQLGKTNQFITAPHYGSYLNWEGRTKYQTISLLGDLNLSMLFRRIDNNSEFKWALHGYAGGGILGYTAERIATNAPAGHKYENWRVVKDINLSDRSLFFQLGAGVQYKINNRFDLELRGMYFLSGDEEFDASGNPDPGVETLADFEEGRDDNMLTLSLGLHYKLGKHKDHLRWVDPLKNMVSISGPSNEPCVDSDNDGVCDAQDKCPDTPEGMKVDGSGCPLDSDNDGVPDTIDQCPTIPGPPTNNGCPLTVVEVSMEDIADILTQMIEGIEFDYNKDVIRPISYPKLDAAFTVLQAHPDYKFYVEGHTDAAGSVQYNQDLSERRAASVVRYLVNKGVAHDQLYPVGKGKTDLKHPECDPVSNCPPWKNLENRRVIFKPYNNEAQNSNIEFKP